jgi:hypothetical protein
MECDFRYFQEDLNRALRDHDGRARGPEEYKLSISTTFIHPDSSRKMEGYLSSQSRCYLIGPERILKADDLDSLKEYMGENSMSSAEITELLRKKRIGSSSIKDLVKNAGSWQVRLPDIEMGSQIRNAYSPIVGHSRFKTRNFFKMLADQMYFTKRIEFHEHGDSSISTGAMGWSHSCDYIGDITAKDFLDAIDTGIRAV